MTAFDDELDYAAPYDLSFGDLIRQLDAYLVGLESSAFSGDLRLAALVRELIARAEVEGS